VFRTAAEFAVLLDLLLGGAAAEAGAFIVVLVVADRTFKPHIGN
jgi:hypothetical protein